MRVCVTKANDSNSEVLRFLLWKTEWDAFLVLSIPLGFFAP